MEKFAAEGAVTTYVGKRGAAKAFQQAEIDQMLVDHCLQVCINPCASAHEALATPGPLPCGKGSCGGIE